MKRFLILLTLTGLVLTACAGRPTPNIESTVQAAIAATQTAQPAHTPTPQPPTNTPIPKPTDTSTPRPTHTPTPVSPTTTPTITITGRVLGNFTSVCDFSRPALSPPEAIWASGAEVKITGCVTLDEELQSEQPLAIIIQVQNPTTLGSMLILPWPSEVIVHTEGDTRSALALYFLWTSAGQGWATKGKGQIEVEVKPSTTVELLYLLPGFDGEATVEFGNSGSFKVNTLDTPLPTYTPAPTDTPAHSAASDSIPGKWSLTGQLIENFTSICGNYYNPELSYHQTVEAITEVQVESVGCQTLDKKLQSEQPLMLRIEIQNLTNSSGTFILPWPSQVIVHTTTDSKPTLAFHWEKDMWVIEGNGEFMYVVEPNGVTQLLYLLPGFSGESTIELPNIGSVKVNTSSSP